MLLMHADLLEIVGAALLGVAVRFAIGLTVGFEPCAVTVVCWRYSGACTLACVLGTGQHRAHLRHASLHTRAKIAVKVNVKGCKQIRFNTACCMPRDSGQRESVGLTSCEPKLSTTSSVEESTQNAARTSQGGVVVWQGSNKTVAVHRVGTLRSSGSKQ